MHPQNNSEYSEPIQNRNTAASRTMLSGTGTTIPERKALKPLHMSNAEKRSIPIEKGNMSNGKTVKAASKSAWIMKGTRHSIKVFDTTQLEASSTRVESSAGFELLCSYNWVQATSPSIYVPGAPPQWTPIDLPVTLPRDTGTHFIDQNTFRAPTYPFEPLFQALSIMKPTFNFCGVDLVANRNSLRKLLNFTTGRVPESFRIDLHVVDRTLFLTRRERSTREIIRGYRNSGFGHNFERAFTKPEAGLEDGIGHHRVVRYALGDLKCVVQFEVDAYCEANIIPPDSGTAASDAFARPQSDDPLWSFRQLSLAEANPQQTAQYQFTRAIPRGHVIPSSNMAEIKARSSRLRLQEILPQLWFGRTPYLFIGTHRGGTFEKVDSIDVTARFREWETKHQEELRKMARLIADLRETAMELSDGMCVAVCDHKIKPPRLQILISTATKNILPDKLVKQYWRNSCPPA